MKRIVLSVTLLIFSQLAFSQYLSLQELDDLNKMSWDDFDTYVTKKEYSFSKTVKTKYKDGSFHYDNKTYSANENENGTMATYFITKYISEANKNRMVRFQTGKNKDYLQIKKELTDMEYKFLKSYSVSDSTIVFEYKKGEINVQIFSTKSKNAGNTYSTIYELCFTTY